MEILDSNNNYTGILNSNPHKPLDYGDLVIVYAGYDSIYCFQLARNGICNLKYGNFKHNDLVGKCFGSKVYDDRTKKWMAIIRPTAEFITLTTPHRTQILYQADISLVIMLLNAVPNKRIVESGTGSGSLSTSIARAIAPRGQLFTFEVHDERYQKARNAFKEYGLNSLITISQRDIYTQGFPPELYGTIDSAFLDLPAPWLAVTHVKNALKIGGLVVSFSPCIEQVQNMCEMLESNKFTDIRTFEILTKPIGITLEKEQKGNYPKRIKIDESQDAECQNCDQPIKKNQLLNKLDAHFTQFPLPMKSHSGYLTVSRRC